VTTSIGGTWVLPEDIPSGARVGLIFAWFPYPQVEVMEDFHWKDGDPPPMPPNDFLMGEWRPSPCFETWSIMRNYKMVSAVVGLFDEDEHVKFYALGMEWLIPKGTPQIALLLDDEHLKAPHEPPAKLR
jgi:hypothetical protein